MRIAAQRREDAKERKEETEVAPHLSLRIFATSRLCAEVILKTGNSCWM